MEIKAELKKAYWWYCPICGHENFGRVVMWEGNKEQKEEIAKKIGTSSDQLEYCVLPVLVKCGYCDREFESIDGDSDSEFDDDLSNWA